MNTSGISPDQPFTGPIGPGSSITFTNINESKPVYTFSNGLLQTPHGAFRVTKLVVGGQEQNVSSGQLNPAQQQAIEKLARQIFEKIEADDRSTSNGMPNTFKDLKKMTVSSTVDNKAQVLTEKTTTDTIRSRTVDVDMKQIFKETFSPPSATASPSSPFFTSPSSPPLSLDSPPSAQRNYDKEKEQIESSMNNLLDLINLYEKLNKEDQQNNKKWNEDTKKDLGSKLTDYALLIKDHIHFLGSDPANQDQIKRLEADLQRYRALAEQKPLTHPQPQANMEISDLQWAEAMQKERAKHLEYLDKENDIQSYLNSLIENMNNFQAQLEWSKTNNKPFPFENSWLQDTLDKLNTAFNDLKSSVQEHIIFLESKTPTEEYKIIKEKLQSHLEKNEDAVTYFTNKYTQPFPPPRPAEVQAMPDDLAKQAEDAWKEEELYRRNIYSIMNNINSLIANIRTLESVSTEANQNEEKLKTAVLELNTQYGKYKVLIQERMDHLSLKPQTDELKEEIQSNEKRLNNIEDMTKFLADTYARFF